MEKPNVKGRAWDSLITIKKLGKSLDNGWWNTRLSRICCKRHHCQFVDATCFSFSNVNQKHCLRRGWEFEDPRKFHMWFVPKLELVHLNSLLSKWNCINLTLHLHHIEMFQYLNRVQLLSFNSWWVIFWHLSNKLLGWFKNFLQSLFFLSWGMYGLETLNILELCTMLDIDLHGSEARVVR